MTPRDIRRGELPDEALLRRYRTDGHLTDCFHLDIARPVSLPQYAGAFFTSWLFRRELWLIGKAGRPSATPAEAWQLAKSETGHFSVWQVEARDDRQLLLRDSSGQTRTWLMVLPSPLAAHTRLLFGSAVIARANPTGGPRRVGWGFRLLLPIHLLYSRMLLQAAADNLET